MNIVGCNKGLRAGRAVSAALAAALLLTCCIKEDAGSCSSVGGPDGEVTVGFRSGTFAISGPSGADDGWGTSATGARSVATGVAMGASTRAGIPPTGMVEGAFQIGDLWVDGNRGSTQEKPMTWAEATKYCLALKLRLPTYDEMNDIMSYVVENSPLPDNRRFAYWMEAWKDYNYYYWTSTPRNADASFVWMGYLNPDNWPYMDGLRANDKETSARCVKREGEEILPPAPDPGPDVENPDGLPVGTTFRVVVYEAGADPQSESPVDQNTYKIADAKGTIVASAVDEFGNATDDAARELVLRRGAYDFYYFSPAVPASTSMPNPGRYTDLANGADYMALAHREVIDPSKGPKHYIPEVCFYRMGSYIDVRITPREGEIMGTLEVSGDGLQLWGLPGSGRYEIGEYPYRLITEGSGGMVEFSPTDFAAEEGATATVTTLGTGGGHAVLPGYARDLQVKVTLTSDGKELKLDASLAGHTFAPGYRYVVELGVGRIADNPELSIDILPWNEYDWGDGNIGGELPIDTGGSGTVLDSDPGQKMSWQEAIDYCSSKGDGWRLPTQNELFYYWCVQPSIPAGSKFLSDYYWSATVSSSGLVWGVNFVLGGTNTYAKTGSIFVRCVIDKAQGEEKYPYVTTASDGGVIVVLRDENGGIDEASLFSSRVTETKTGNEASADNRMSRKFRVQKSNPGQKTWSDAVSYCDNLTEEGYSDWRLPSQRELMMIWLLGGNSNVTSGDKNDTGVGGASKPVNTPYIYQQSGFTAFSANYNWSATLWSDNDYAWHMNFSNGSMNHNGTMGISSYVRCIRDEDGSAPTYTVSEASVTPAGDIPAEGKAYSLTLTGNLPLAGVDVRAQSGGTALVTGKVTASGTAVELAVPMHSSYTERTVTFEYNWNGTWTKIGDDRTQQGYNVTTATHDAPAPILGQGGTYNVTLTGSLPAAGVDVRAQSGGTALVTGKVTASGTAVELAVPMHSSYTERTVTFEYNWNGTWTKIGDDRTQQGYNVTTATHDAPQPIPFAGGTYKVTLTGWGTYAVRAVISGTETVLDSDMTNTDDPTKTEITKDITIPKLTSATLRQVEFQYRFNGQWLRIGEVVGQGRAYWSKAITRSECESECRSRGGILSAQKAQTTDFLGIALSDWYWLDVDNLLLRPQDGQMKVSYYASDVYWCRCMND